MGTGGPEVQTEPCENQAWFSDLDALPVEGHALAGSGQSQVCVWEAKFHQVLSSVARSIERMHQVPHVLHEQGCDRGGSIITRPREQWLLADCGIELNRPLKKDAAEVTQVL